MEGFLVIILVINCGSSSLKYQLLNMQNEKVLSKGICDGIGLDGSFLKYQTLDQEEIIIRQAIPDHSSAVQLVLNYLTDKEYGVVASPTDISAVGHRVVHGGEYFQQAVVIDDDVLNKIGNCAKIAPLHNPANIIGIEACRVLLPNIPMVAVFDTSFHQTMPKHAYTYGLPYDYYEKYKIRKYGFHGTSHKYVANKAAEIVGKPLQELKIISCHLGNGASICAIDRGESIDTTMGFTPLEGLVMGTRCGSIDPQIISFIMDNENLDVTNVMNILNKKSGLLGISGISSDFRDIQKLAFQNNERAKLAIDIFSYKIKLYIGQYMAALNGVDIIIFTGGIGEHAWQVRKNSLDNLDSLGVRIDSEKNKDAVHQSLNCKEIEISASHSKVRTFIIRTNEELMIAKDTVEVLSPQISL